MKFRFFTGTDYFLFSVISKGMIFFSQDASFQIYALLNIYFMQIILCLLSAPTESAHIDIRKYQGCPLGMGKKKHVKMLAVMV